MMYQPITQQSDIGTVRCTGCGKPMAVRVHTAEGARLWTREVVCKECFGFDYYTASHSLHVADSLGDLVQGGQLIA